MRLLEYVQTASKQIFYHLRLLCLLGIALLVTGLFFFQKQLLTPIPPLPNPSGATTAITPEAIIPFPISVNPDERVIFANEEFDVFMTEQFASNHTPPRGARSIFAFLTDEVFRYSWLQQLASPVSRTLVIYSGQRAEEIAHSYQKILGWNNEETQEFLLRISTQAPELRNGLYYPGRYQLHKNSSPEEAAAQISDRFDSYVRVRYTEAVEEVVPLTETLVIASMIEREAYDFTDMRIISGIIWNRLFINMPLQLDATLQFVRGGESHEPWWPIPRPSDKFLDSPFNTYKYRGLPPEPIANPSLDAIIATLNPVMTDCYFYLHAPGGKFYCSETYEEHKALIRKHF